MPSLLHNKGLLSREKYFARDLSHLVKGIYSTPDLTVLSHPRRVGSYTKRYTFDGPEWDRDTGSLKDSFNWKIVEHLPPHTSMIVVDYSIKSSKIQTLSEE